MLACFNIQIEGHLITGYPNESMSRECALGFRSAAQALGRANFHAHNSLTQKDSTR